MVPKAAVKKTRCGKSRELQNGWYDRTIKVVRDLSCGAAHVYPAGEISRAHQRKCGTVMSERLDWLAGNALYSNAFAA